jgi:hypothetical protein
MKSPKRLWALSNASSLRRNSSSPAQTRFKKAPRSACGYCRASVNMDTTPSESSPIQKQYENSSEKGRTKFRQHSIQT